MSNTIEKAKQLGISETELKLALILMRQLRIDMRKAALHPKAQRVAILYIEEVDRHFAEQKLSFKEMNKLREIAHKFYEETAQRLLY